MKTSFKFLPITILLFFHLQIFAQSTYKVAIDYQFDDAQPFSDYGLAAVKRDAKWGYIDSKGNVVIGFQYSKACMFAPNGLAGVEKNYDSFMGFINQKGDLMIDFKLYSGISPIEFSSNGLVNIGNQKDKWGFIDSNGKNVIGFKYNGAQPFAPNGLAAVCTEYSNGYKWGFVNTQGNVVINLFLDYTLGFSENGMAAARIGKKWGFIGPTGNTLINFQYEDAKNFASNGLAAVKNNNKWGYIDTKGNTVIDFQYYDAKDFSPNGLAPVASCFENWGFIDAEGNVAIDFQFNYASPFSTNGLSLTVKHGKAGYIRIYPPFEEITDYIEPKIREWQEKGKYESTDVYMSRVSENNRKKKLEELSDSAIQVVARKYSNLKIRSTEYDADNQTFKLTTKGIPPIYVKVPMAEAEAFDKSVAKIKFEKPQYALGNDEKFFLQSANVVNPSNGKIYSYSSTDQAVFAYTKLNMNFEPLQVNVQTTQKSQNVQTETKTLSIGLSDVDTNIPANPQTNKNTFVVIISNENYQSEVKVQYALNDGNIFKDYCEKTLGIPSKNIHFAKDATFGKMKSEIKWISDVIGAFNGKAKVIFYYAGHGMPNEADKSAYLLPIDGISTDYETAIKLNELYARLTEKESQNVTVFLDACFSGSQRDNRMLANARGVKIKPKESMLGKNMVVFSAATGDETAYPYKEKQHGLFTYFLLKKLQETNGDVDFKTLSNYITENVKQQSIVVNQKSQTPQVNSSSEMQEQWKSLKLR